MELSWVKGSLGGAISYSKNAKLSCFDLASLTKIVVTSSLLFELLFEEGLAFSEKRLTSWLPEFKGHPLGEISLQKFWEHRSGLPGHVNVFGARHPKDCSRELLSEHILLCLKKLELSSSPRTMYSDLGFMVLGVFLERYYVCSLAQLWTRYKLRFENGFAFPDFAPAHRKNVVPTEQRHPAGEVNDDNAYSMGGVAPHAGLFGTAEELSSWLIHFSTRLQEHSRIWDEFRFRPRSRFVLGWDHPESAESHAGPIAAASVRGHLGYTGTSLFWDTRTSKFGVQLTNRVFPEHSEESKKRIQRLRQEFYSSVWTM